jgi:hypothetical protein
VLASETSPRERVFNIWMTGRDMGTSGWLRNDFTEFMLCCLGKGNALLLLFICSLWWVMQILLYDN